MATVNFFLVDPDTFEDIPAGSVTVDGNKITSENEDLLDVAHSAGDSPEAILNALSDWSNGYLRSELAEEPLLSSGTITLTEPAVPESTLLSMVDRQSVIPDPVVPEPVVPEPITPEPVVPEPVVPEPVVPAPLALLSMIDLDATKVDEFFNKHHSKDGRFAPGKSKGSGGGGNLLAKAPEAVLTPKKDPSNSKPWPKFGGDYPVKQIAEGGLFRKKIDGFRVKSAYEVTAKDGNKIKVYDIDGKTFGAQHKKVANAMADMHGMYPMKPPRSLVIINRKAKGEMFQGALMWMYPKRPHIFVNQNETKRLDPGLADNLQKKKWFMPSFNKGNANQYLMFHEYGHHHDYHGSTVTDRGDHRENNRSYHEANALWKNTEIRGHLSTYGRHHQVEGYAEAFAEWHNSKGKTKNAAAVTYARNEGWYGSGTKAIRAAGFLDAELPAFEPWVFALEDDEATGDDLKDLFPFDPEQEEPIIIFYLDRPPEIRGLEPGGGQPTADEVAEAAALIREVMDDLNNTEDDAVTATGLIQLMLPDMVTEEPQPVGEPIDLLSLVSLDAEKVDEFYNKHHGKDGRFGAGNHTGGAAEIQTAEQEIINRVESSRTRHPLSGGQSGAKVELVGGPKGLAILKSGIDKDTHDAEYLGFRVGKALGAPVATVASMGPDKLAVEYIKGRTVRGWRPKYPPAMAGGREIAMLDIAIKNQDRHVLNHIVSPNGKSVTAIDHGLAFADYTSSKPFRMFEDHWKTDLTKSDFTDAKTKLEPLKSEFAKLGREKWYSDMQRRLSSQASRAKD